MSGISKRYNPIIYKAARRYDLPPALIKAVIHVESGFVNDAISSCPVVLWGRSSKSGAPQARRAKSEARRAKPEANGR